MIVEGVVALCMFIQGELKEHRIQVDPESGKPSMSMCLKGKRVAERDKTDSIDYKCDKVKAELEDNIDGSKTIKKIIEE